MIKLILCINSWILWFKRNKRYNLTSGTKINVGSGLIVAPGWINVDYHPAIIFCKFPSFILRYFSKYVPDVDISPEQCALIMHTNKFIHHQLNYGCPFSDISADYIYTSHLLEHLDKDKANYLIKEFYRVLKNGGRLRICVPDLDYFISLYKNRNYEEGLRPIFSHGHRYMYNFDMLQQLLAKHGFKDIIKCTYKIGETPDIAILDNRPGETLYLEAVKP